MNWLAVGFVLTACALQAQQMVDAVAVISMPVERKVELSGELMPFQQAAIRSMDEGVLQKVLVDRGSRVAENDLLAVLGNGGEIRAPFAGLITARYAHPGETVGPHDAALFDLAQVNRLRLVLSIPEENSGSIPRGDIAFRVPAFPASVFHARVTRSAGALDPKTHVLPVEADVQNSSGRLMPGMRASANWRVLSQGSVTLVPQSAIAMLDKKTRVARIRNGTVEWIDVTRGEQNGDLVTVEGALDAGDLIARQGSAAPRPGTHVQTRMH